MNTLTSRVTPVVGHFSSKSVATLNPLDQQLLVKAPFVQAESATLVAVGVAELDELLVVFIEEVLVVRIEEVEVLTEEVLVLVFLTARFNRVLPGGPSSPQRM